jgi:molecular chaperone HscB
MSADGCWKCGQASEESLFCQFCNSLQPPTPDYFGFFNLDRSLNIDAGELQQRYYTLSRQIHPDCFQRGAANERQFALDATAILNDAYRTLRDPISRAEYVLKEEGFIPAERKSKRVPPELLEQVFEANMALEELRGGDTTVRPAVEQSLTAFRALREEVDREMKPLFTYYDRDGQRDVLGKIRGLLDRRSYISNLIEDLEEGLSV